ncbi:alpha/beta hydrolase [Microbacterium sp. LMI1-1-1.1]|uniref:alpha/beta hydrolase n=1 Tax=Microbacterium sp. LMI1-1-1.1 TaxID=3135223 RepID=UPI003465D072
MTPIRRRSLAAAALAVLALTVTACTPGGDAEPTAAPIVVEKDLTYPGGDGSALGVDACRPDDDTAHPAVVLVHGGAFSEGDRTTMAGVCSELAKNGYAAFAVDYRQLPATYPAQIDDVQASVLWLREPEQVERFRLSSTVSLLGSSAGAIISLSTAAALAGNDAPVASVVALSPAGSLTADAAELGDPRPDLEKVVLGYLGCDVITDCPIAEQASPVASAALLPPTLIVHGTDELIPLAQAELLDDALSTDGIEHELVVVDGTRHGLQLLDSAVKADVIEFLGAHAS